MTAEELIQELRDIHLPESVSNSFLNTTNWWPVLVYLVIIAIIFWISRRRSRYWRTQVESELADIQKLSDANHLDRAWQQLAELLRRIALITTSDQTIAKQTGDRWLNTLDNLFNTDIFSTDADAGLAYFPYAPPEIHAKQSANNISRDTLQQMLTIVHTGLPKLKKFK